MSCAVVQALSEAAGVDFVVPFKVSRLEGNAGDLKEMHVVVIRTNAVELMRVD